MQGEKKCKRTFQIFHELDYGRAGLRVPCGVDPEQRRLVNMRGMGGNRGCAIPVFPRASLGKGWYRGGTKPWASKEEHRTLGQIIIIFFDILPRIFWERVRLTYCLTYEGPLHSSISD